MTRREAPRGTQAVQRAIKLLKSFATSDQELSLRELSERQGLARPTAHRILAALEAEGLVARNEETSGYRLSALSAPLAARSRDRPEPRSESTATRQLATGQEGPLVLPRRSPFFARLLEHNRSWGFRPWSGHVGATSYEPTFQREYYAIRNGVALIDVSPLFKYEVSGRGALATLQRMMTRDLRKCRVGQVMYGCWCDDEGKLVQDGNVIRLAEDRFRISAADPSFGWIEDCAAGFDARVDEVTEEVAVLSVQGPRSRQLLQRVLEDVDLISLRYFRASAARFASRPLIVSRTGFTGDLGYELWIESERAPVLLDRLLEEGRDYGALPVGLVAMDAARIEAGLVLIDVDYVSAPHAFLDGRKSSPYEAGLGWTVKLVSGNEFVGRPALEREQELGSEWATVGIEIEWPELERVHAAAGLRPQSPGQPPCREPTPVYQSEPPPGLLGRAADRPSGRQVGQITSQTFSPLLKKQIGLATLETASAGTGAEVEVELMVDRHRARARGRVVALPFYSPAHKTSHGRAIAR